MSSSTKAKVALFPGTENNCCVYTINGREQSSFSGEIWTLQLYHLLLPLNPTVHFTNSYMTGSRLCVSFLPRAVFTMQHFSCTCQQFTSAHPVCSTPSSELRRVWTVLLHRRAILRHLMYVFVFWHEILKRVGKPWIRFSIVIILWRTLEISS